MYGIVFPNILSSGVYMNTATVIDRREDEIPPLQLISFPTSKELENDQRLLQPNADVTPSNFQDITNMIESIGHLEDQIALYGMQSEEAVMFFKSKMNTAQLRIDQLKTYIKAFLDSKVLKNIQTPRGTAYIRRINLRHWGDPDALLTWTQANVPQAVRVKYEPDKKQLSEYFKKTGDVPPDYCEQPEERLYIKL